MKSSKLACRVALAGQLILLGACSQDDANEGAAGGPRAAQAYSYDWDSLKQAPVPEWLEDAKFGIFIHWGPYSVPGWSDGEDYSEWYSTQMYRKPEFMENLRRNFGEPGEFGYADFIPRFRGERFSADGWVDLFQRAGAKYVIPTGEHHDGFVMWDTELSPWNAVDMGPEVDFIGEMARATRDKGLKFGISYHRERHWGFYTDSLNTYKEHPQPLPAIAREIQERPETASLYGPFELTEEFMRDYKARFLEAAGKYRPDFMWIDDSPANSLFPEAPAVRRFIDKYHLEMLVDYMNMAGEWGRQVYFNNKMWHRSNYPAGAGVDEKDYLRMDGISPLKWQSSGGMDHSYGYDRSEDEADSYRSVDELVETLIDVVSKNGNFLLDVGPKPDGTIPEGQKRRLLGIGEWLAVNGEAIYGTRPWSAFGREGLRFTASGDTLYAILFDWPGNGLSLDVAGDLRGATVESVALLGDKGDVQWRVAEGKLLVEFAGEKNEDHAHTLKIALASS